MDEQGEGFASDPYLDADLAFLYLTIVDDFDDREPAFKVLLDAASTDGEFPLLELKRVIDALRELKPNKRDATLNGYIQSYDQLSAALSPADRKQFLGISNSATPILSTPTKNTMTDQLDQATLAILNQIRASGPPPIRPIKPPRAAVLDFGFGGTGGSLKRGRVEDSRPSKRVMVDDARDVMAQDAFGANTFIPAEVSGQFIPQPLLIPASAPSQSNFVFNPAPVRQAITNAGRAVGRPAFEPFQEVAGRSGSSIPFTVRTTSGPSKAPKPGSTFVGIMPHRNKQGQLKNVRFFNINGQNVPFGSKEYRDFYGVTGGRKSSGKSKKKPRVFPKGHFQQLAAQTAGDPTWVSRPDIRPDAEGYVNDHVYPNGRPSKLLGIPKKTFAFKMLELREGERFVVRKSNGKLRAAVAESVRGMLRTQTGRRRYWPLFVKVIPPGATRITENDAAKVLLLSQAYKSRNPAKVAALVEKIRPMYQSLDATKRGSVLSKIDISKKEKKNIEVTNAAIYPSGKRRLGSKAPLLTGRAARAAPQMRRGPQDRGTRAQFSARRGQASGIFNFQ